MREELMTDDLAINEVTRDKFYWCVNKNCVLFIHRVRGFQILLCEDDRSF
ncbi:MAG: hypothetical protein QXX95_01975 [Nitrososphaerales archaeon]